MKNNLPSTLSAVALHRQFQTPHRLGGDGLSKQDKARLASISDPLLRAQKEYERRQAKVEHALQQFIKRHKTGQILEHSLTLNLFSSSGAAKDFAPYVHPAEFRLVLRALLDEPFGGRVPGPGDLVNGGDIEETGKLLSRLRQEGALPNRPLVRLAMFGARQEVITIGQWSRWLQQAEALEVPLASAILLFAFKNTPEQETHLAQLVLATSYNDKVLMEAAQLYLSAIRKGETP